ncbi:MAG TPA: DoxX-like family protein [Flavobacteriales bacterium]|nr:DoxX-like family protein [Flavobacteriales bacterium]
MKDISLYIMAAFYIFAGYYHFKNPKFFLRLIPPYLPWHKGLNYLSGAIEIFLGLLLLCPEYSSYAAWGIIALLIAVFPANIYHLQSTKPGGKEPVWVLRLRLPFQLVFLLWAWWYTF